MIESCQAVDRYNAIISWELPAGGRSPANCALAPPPIIVEFGLDTTSEFKLLDPSGFQILAPTYVQGIPESIEHSPPPLSAHRIILKSISSTCCRSPHFRTQKHLLTALMSCHIWRANTMVYDVIYIYRLPASSKAQQILDSQQLHFPLPSMIYSHITLLVF